MDEPVWLNRTIIEAIHADQIREHGGRPGLRDAAVLESALARARQRWTYEPSSTLPRLAAEYGFGLVKGHPFVDGNKRAAFSAMNVFLLLNGSEIEAPEPEVVDVMVRLAAGELDADGLADWLASVVVAGGG